MTATTKPIVLPLKRTEKENETKTKAKDKKKGDGIQVDARREALSKADGCAYMQTNRKAVWRETARSLSIYRCMNVCMNLSAFFCT
jgi:hypothetical protein